jgi:hypothetical protein
MMIYPTATILTVITAAVASAQYYGPGAPPLNYLPNYYNRATQPLSPYLNLLRGSNPGVDYYYGTRPGTPAGGVNTFGQPPVYNPFVGPAAGGFLPQSAIPFDAAAPAYEAGGKPVVLRSAGQQVIYGNRFLGHGSFQSVMVGNRGGASPNPGQQLPRSSPQGLGTAPPRR